MTTATRPAEGFHMLDGIYADRGCEVSPSCLACPLKYCKHDVPRNIQRKQDVDARIREVLINAEAPLSTREIAARAQVNERTVYRFFERARAS